MSFQAALSVVLVTLLYILPGYIVSKLKRASASHLPTLSGILIYACTPCMIISAFLGLDYSPELLGNLALFFLFSLAGQCAFMALMYLLTRHRFADVKYRLMTVGMVMGNVGFFGQPIVRALLPDHPEAVCYSSAFMVSMNILVFTMGVYCLTHDKKYISLKTAVVNPAGFALPIGIILFIAGGRTWVPKVVSDALSVLGNMTTPLCMIILGIRLSQMKLRSLFVKPFVYLIIAGKLLAFPLFCYALSFLLPVDAAFRSTVLILCATPCAAMVLSLAEIHDAGQ